MGKSKADVLALLRLWQQPGRWRSLADLPRWMEEHRAARSQTLADKRFALENGVGDAELSARAAEAYAEAFNQLRRQCLALQAELAAIEEYLREHCPDALRCLPVPFSYDSPPTDGFEARAQAMREIEVQMRTQGNRGEHFSWELTEPFRDMQTSELEKALGLSDKTIKARLGEHDIQARLIRKGIYRVRQSFLENYNQGPAK